MTLPAYSEESGGLVPSETEKASARQLRKILAAHAAGDATLRLLDEHEQTTEIVLGPALSGLLEELLEHIEKGDAVTLVPMREMLTTQQAADMLNVSRPFLISLLEKNHIAYDTVGRHRRIKAEDLFAYKQVRDQKRRKALADLAELDGEELP